MAQILLADDEPLFAMTTAQFLEEHGHAVLCHKDGFQVSQEVSASNIDLVIADLDMPGNRELELLSDCRVNYPHVPFIVVTGRPTLPSAIEGIRLGIHDYFLKPFDLDDLLHSINRALVPPASSNHLNYNFEDILGQSPAVHALKLHADRIAASQATVLITGESGTGKELLANAIHRRSRRSDKPFVIVDCTTIPEALMESTLFGYAKGAFTGADRDRVGLVQLADGGTLFLDEIGELPLPLQAKLLRMLQFGSYLPVGSTTERKVDLRILAATHRNLQQEVALGRFRLDLFYRMSVLEITSPPLRDRLEDIPKLASHFLKRIANRDGGTERVLSNEAKEMLTMHPWPGNIRELQNVMERCACLASSTWITSADIARLIDKNLSQSNRTLPWSTTVNSKSWQDYRDSAEREYFSQLLQSFAGNIAQAAKAANISRQGFHKALNRLGLSPSDYRATRH